MNKYYTMLLDRIAKWKQLIIDYPLSDAYKKALFKAEQERADYVNKIGRK